MSQEPPGITQKVAREVHVLERVVEHLAYWRFVKRDDARSREGEKQGGMRGHNELGVLRQHLLDQGNEPELALWREWRFGLVQQIQAAGNKAVLKDLEKALAVAVKVMARRNVQASDVYRNVFRQVYQMAVK